MDEEFRAPDWSAPLDPAPYLAAVPKDATIRGMFPADIVKELARGGHPAPGRGRYVPFKNYPMREFMQLALDGSELLYPRLPERERLRRLGRRNFTTFIESLAGKVVLGALGKRFDQLIAASGKAYEVTQSHARVKVVQTESSSSVLHYVGLYQFLDALELGVLEAAMEACEVRGDIEIKMFSLCDAHVRITWG